MFIQRAGHNGFGSSADSVPFALLIVVGLNACGRAVLLGRDKNDPK